MKSTGKDRESERKSKDGRETRNDIALGKLKSEEKKLAEAEQPRST